MLWLSTPADESITVASHCALSQMIHVSNFYKIVENYVLDENISKGRLNTRAYNTHLSTHRSRIYLFLCFYICLAFFTTFFESYEVEEYLI